MFAFVHWLEVTPAPKKTSSSKKRPAQQKVGTSLILLISIALLLEAAFVNLVPLSVQYFIDVVMPSRDLGAIYPVVGVLGGAVVLVILAGLLRDVFAARAVSRLISRMRKRVFDRLQQALLSNESAERNAEMLEGFSMDTGEIEQSWRAAVPRGILPILIAIVSSVVLMVIDWRGFGALFLWPWVLLAPQAMGVRVAKADAAYGEDEERLLAAMEENLAAQAAVRAFSLEHTASQIFRKRNDLLVRSSIRAGVAQAFAERLTTSGIIAIQVFVLCMNMQLATGKHLSVGTVVGAQMLIMILSYSLLTLSQYLPERESANAALERVEEIMARPSGPEDSREARALPPIATEIGFSNVCFSYDESPQNHVAFLTARIPKGSYVAFVGPSGCGKTTLLRLLMRFHDPHDGRITIDGHDLKSITRASLRARIGVVLQDNPVFSMTIGENLRVGRADASQEAIVEAAKAAGLHDLIAALPQGYNTPAGAGGVKLPSPILQRLGIARAILRNPDILLLDEVTSALEPAEELSVNEGLRELRKGRTVISMTHRLATTADADHIFMMEEGRIVEQGSHFELLAADGAYARLWRKQAGFHFSSDGRHVDVDAARLKHFPILEKLSEEKLAEIAPYFATETYPPGRDLVRQNEPGDKFYIIARGKVEVWRAEEHSGRVMRMAVLQEGDFFGEITLITGFPRTATVRTLTVCTCISLERGQFNRMLERSPELLKEMSDVALKRLRETARAATVTVQ
jgi:ATP-binding cassette subfamily B protein